MLFSRPISSTSGFSAIREIPPTSSATTSCSISSATFACSITAKESFSRAAKRPTAPDYSGRRRCGKGEGLRAVFFLQAEREAGLAHVDLGILLLLGELIDQ